MLNSKKLKFETAFKLTNLSLRMSGCHPAQPRDLKWASKSFVTISFSVLVLYILSNSIFYYRIPNKEYADVIREAIIDILAFTVICKYSILVFNRKTVYNLISYINDDFAKSTNFSEDELKTFNGYVNRGVNASKVWILTAGLTGITFAAKGIFSTIYYHCIGVNKYVQIVDMVLPMSINSYKDELFGYCTLCSMLCVFDVYTMFVYIGYEPLICIFLLHSCGQLEILSYRMKNIFSQSKRSEILNEVKAINLKLQSIYDFIEDVQTTFVPLFEFNMKTTTVVLPFSAFQIVQSFWQHEINVEFLSLLTCALLQFYLPCYYSDHLMEKSDKMRLAIYSCGWEKEPNLRIRKMLLIMLTRTSRPVVLNTFFYPLCLETFAEMCRQAYAIYNIMMAV